MARDPSRVALILFLVLSAGVFAAIAITAWSGRLKQLQMAGIVVAGGSLVACLGLVVARLGHPERVFGAFQNLRSPLPQQLLTIFVAGGLMLIYFRTLQNGKRMPRVLCGAAVLVSVLLLVVFLNPGLFRVFFAP
jgi:hypothetical protein